MSIEALVDPAPAVLCAAAARPDVTSAMNEAHVALADLRFSEGLRRGWEEARAEAAVREAAALTAHFRFRRVFDPASSVVGGGLARWILVTRGVDPTGVCVPAAYDALDPARAGRELAGWVSADEAGLARWIIHYCAGVVYGAQVGRDVARHVQAGRLS